MPSLFSDLDLHGKSTPESQPRLGQWGPKKVPSTRFKKWQKWLIMLSFPIFSALLFGYGYLIYLFLNQAG